MSIPLLPLSQITRTLKTNLDGSQIQKQAKSAFSVSATLFISYITTLAEMFCERDGKKTLMKSYAFLYVFYKRHFEKALKEAGFTEIAEEVARLMEEEAKIKEDQDENDENAEEIQDTLGKNKSIQEDQESQDLLSSIPLKRQISLSPPLLSKKQSLEF